MRSIYDVTTYQFDVNVVSPLFSCLVIVNISYLGLEEAHATPCISSK